MKDVKDKGVNNEQRHQKALNGEVYRVYQGDFALCLVPPLPSKEGLCIFQGGKTKAESQIPHYDYLY